MRRSARPGPCARPAWAGYRGKVFSLLGRAARLDTPERDPGELRREASAGLGDFAGLEPLVLRDFDKESSAMAIHPRSEWIAVGLADGTVRFHDPTDWPRADATGQAPRRVSRRWPPRLRAASWSDTPTGPIRVVEYEPRSRTLRTTRQTQG